MNVVFIGIAGGSGAGKSSLCSGLMDKYPDTIGMLQLDDYFKPSDSVPTLLGHENWDHPEALYLDKLAQDISSLSGGASIQAYTKNEKLNPDYAITEKRIIATFLPKPIMLVEGYLVLWSEAIRSQLQTSIWLEVDHDIRWERRVHFKNDKYEEEVIKPMYEKYVARCQRSGAMDFDDLLLAHLSHRPPI